MNLFLILLGYLIFPSTTGNFLANDKWAIFYNPAYIGHRFIASAEYAEIYSTFEFFRLSINARGAGIGMATVKSGDFYLNSITAGYSFSYSPKVRIGLSGELNQMFEKGGEGLLNSFKINAGLLVNAGDRRKLGISIFNVVSTGDLYIKRQIVFSSLNGLTHSFEVMFDAVFEESQNVSYVLGAGYRLTHFSRLYAGISTNPLSYHASIEFSKILDFTYSISIHPYLGISNFVSISR